MAALARQRPFLDVFDWVDQFPPLFAARSLISPHLIRVEDKIEDNHYVIRAEMPGLDPDKDVKITVEENTLVIDAERTEEKSDKNRSEFQYGAFRRAMALPGGREGRRHQGHLHRRHPHGHDRHRGNTIGTDQADTRRPQLTRC